MGTTRTVTNIVTGLEAARELVTWASLHGHSGDVAVALLVKNLWEHALASGLPSAMERAEAWIFSADADAATAGERFLVDLHEAGAG